MGVNSLPWYYSRVLSKAGDTVILGGDEWHHCFQVLRMTPGESVILFDGKGQCLEGIIRSASKNEGTIELIQDRSHDFRVDQPYKLTVAFAPTKNIDRTEFAVEKLVELGVDEICFLDCEHSERSRIRMDRMEKIILSAAKQSRKINLPGITDLISPNLLVTQYRKEKPETQIFCCHLDETSVPLTGTYSHGQDVLILIGPEGGFTNEETQQMEQRGATLVTLGPYRLRVETAAIAACSAIHVLNDLN
jgi:16S rRNA (uracil1498-N3)-methyltransferase